MNYNMFQNRMGDNIDPNYIYPQPYIDPLMYMNPYFMNNNQNMNFNSNSKPGYSIYSNQYVDNPQFNQYENISNKTMEGEFDSYNNNYNDNYMNNETNSIPMIPTIPPNMMYPSMMFPNMMFPSMIPPSMMYPGMVPPNMMYPGPISNIPTVNMEEFDEEEM